MGKEQTSSLTAVFPDRVPVRASKLEASRDQTDSVILSAIATQLQTAEDQVSVKRMLYPCREASPGTSVQRARNKRTASLGQSRETR